MVLRLNEEAEYLQTQARGARERDAFISRKSLMEDVQMASLDHTMWFHRPFRADDWLLYSIDSPSAQNARGLARGQIFDRAGHLVASTSQEGMIRVIDNDKAGH